MRSRADRRVRCCTDRHGPASIAQARARQSKPFIDRRGNSARARVCREVGNVSIALTSVACLRVARQTLTSVSVGSKAGVCRLYLYENLSFDCPCSL
jgi:hypothetical protein